MRRTATLLIVAAALSGCALPRERIGREMTSGLGVATKDFAGLALAVPDSDNFRMLLSCRPLSGVVDLTVFGLPSDGALVELRSGEVIGKYAGAGHDDEVNIGGVDIDLQLSADDPVLVNFAVTGKLAIHFPH